MKFSEDSALGHYQLRAYGKGWVQVNEQRLTQAFILSPDKLIYPWEPREFTALTPEHLQQVFALPAEIIIMATGCYHLLPKPEIHQALVQQGTGFEIMTIDAACRTYNVLSAEGRAVVAALFPS